MTLQEIETILFEEIYENYGVHGQMHAAKLILASHLRSQIGLLKEMIARMGDKDDKYQLLSKILRLDAELTKLNQ